MNLKHITLGASFSPSIILLHGFLGSSEDWMESAAQLSDRFLCVMPDLPGHGRSLSSDASDYKFVEMAQSIIAVAEMQGLDRPVLLGYSMGGRVALYTALQFPDFFSGLILESASPGLASEGERERRVAEDEIKAAKMVEVGVERFVEEWYNMPLFQSIRRNDRRFERLMDRRKHLDAEGMAMSLRVAGTGSQHSLWHRLYELMIPVLLVVGAEDAKFRDINREMKESLRDCRMREVPGAGHNVHFEQPRMFCDHVQRFIIEHCIESEERF
jgi:2-succinyl-6-hydroxy-2,4-cyclohexadiene-1-carboxylate synthase